MGCGVIVGAFVIASVAFFAFVTFLESGSDTGKVTLEPVESYAPGNVTRAAEHGFFIVVLPDGELLALSDLDAANRASEDSRCRVAPISANDPALVEAMDAYQARMSPEAQSMGLVFREDCNNAHYDALGTRLDADGPNLDRLATSADEMDRLVVDTATRSCSTREGADLAIPVECPG